MAEQRRGREEKQQRQWLSKEERQDRDRDRDRRRGRGKAGRKEGKRIYTSALSSSGCVTLRNRLIS
jgi:hypothetical protein